MKKLVITLVATITLGTALPVLAGPDWRAIEHARKAKQEAQAARHGDAHNAMAPTAAGPAKCMPDAPVLQLDHGPRAQTTPYQNRLRMDRHAAQLKACANARSDPGGRAHGMSPCFLSSTRPTVIQRLSGHQFPQPTLKRRFT